jgi:hypothetical protein
MKSLLASAALTSLLAACATTPSAPSATSAPSAPSAPSATLAPFAANGASETETEILVVIDRFLLAIGNHDDAALEDVLINEGISWFQEIEPGKLTKVSPYPNQTMLEPDPDADPFIERYWSPAVRIRGGLAQVWAPYELRDNGVQIHCGIDAFDLVWLDDAWRIASVLSSMEPQGCAALMPASPAAMRPRDGWRETRNE